MIYITIFKIKSEILRYDYWMFYQKVQKKSFEKLFKTL